ncbi:MAG: lactonase family protein [bacterium]|nr:lactonase family protein [bacterium]
MLLALFIAVGSASCLQFESSVTDITDSPGLALFALLSGSVNGAGTNSVVRTKYVYIPFRNEDTLRILEFNADTGALVETAGAGSPVATGIEPIGVCLHPTQQYLYITQRGSNSVAGYSIDASTGALTALAGSPYAAGTQPWDCEVHPNGNFLYAANFGGGANLSLYTIDPATGVLTAGAAQTSGGNSAQSIAFSSDGSLLFASHTISTDVGVNTVNPTTGALTAVGGSPFASSNFNRQLALTPTGNFLYVPSRNDSNFRIYSVAAGVLSETGGSPIASSGQVQGAVVSPDGNFFYTGQQTAAVVTGYSLDQGTGAPTALGVGPFAASSPQTLYFEPGGSYLFAISSVGASGVAVFQWDSSTGGLTPGPSSPHTFGNSPHQAAFFTETVTQ